MGSDPLCTPQQLGPGGQCLPQSPVPHSPALGHSLSVLTLPVLASRLKLSTAQSRPRPRVLRPPRHPCLPPGTRRDPISPTSAGLLVPRDKVSGRRRCCSSPLASGMWSLKQTVWGERGPGVEPRGALISAPALDSRLLLGSFVCKRERSGLKFSLVSFQYSRASITNMVQSILRLHRVTSYNVTKRNKNLIQWVFLLLFSTC